MAAVLEALTTPHLFRFAMLSLCTWARPQAIIDFDPTTQVDWNGGLIDLAPVDWIPTKKRRPRQPLTQCLAGWLPVWEKEAAEQRATACAAGRSTPEPGLIVYKGKRVATAKRAFRRLGSELGLNGFSQYSFAISWRTRSKSCSATCPASIVRSGWVTSCAMARSQRRITNSDDPDALSDVALATDCVIALIQEYCGRPLFAVDVLLTKGKSAGNRHPRDTRNCQKTEG